MKLTYDLCICNVYKNSKRLNGICQKWAFLYRHAKPSNDFPQYKSGHFIEIYHSFFILFHLFNYFNLT